MTDNSKEHIKRVEESTYCKCGRPKRYWHTQCEVCMGACPELCGEGTQHGCNGTEPSYKQEPKVKEGGGHD